TRARQMIEESERNPVMLGARTAAGAPYPPEDCRTQPLTLEQLDQVTLAAAQAWLEKLIASSPIEVVVVGDLPRERARELLAKYVGALPARERVSPELYAALRKLAQPAGAREVTRAVQTQTPQAYVMSGFYGPDEQNVADVRAMTLAARILSTRMVKEVREQAQLVYSISAGLRPGSTYPGFGLLSAASPTDTAKAPQLVAKLAAMYSALAKDGVTAEELDVAKKQMANTLDQSMREPGFWLGQMSQMTFRGVNLDDVLGAPAAYQALTGDQLRDVFAKYYSPERSVIVIVVPQPAEAGAAAPGGSH
ncbi:MAG: insulinase family protein, partial [Planctomycetota bacterium]